jgi:glucan phosphorylase
VSRPRPCAERDLRRKVRRRSRLRAVRTSFLPSRFFVNPSTKLNRDCITYRLLNTVRHHDHYLLTEDFQSYVDALKLVDEAYLDQSKWLKKSISTCAKMGKFSSDRAILDYAEEYWSIEPLKVE